MIKCDADLVGTDGMTKQVADPRGRTNQTVPVEVIIRRRFACVWSRWKNVPKNSKLHEVDLSTGTAARIRQRVFDRPGGTRFTIFPTSGRAGGCTDSFGARSAGSARVG
uniref:(northern house mosquito) hypothetical protein n=1 Tax=Culex pipiens TaxID=7175 RepID=A0A8D8K0T9_CULPI